MRNVVQFRNRLVTDSLRGTVRRDQLRMSRLKLLQLAQELVIFPIRDRRRGVDIVSPIVFANLIAESGNLFRGSHRKRERTSIKLATEGTENSEVSRGTQWQTLSHS